MAAKGTDYSSLLNRIRLAEDGLAVDEVGEWTLNKLALLSYYLPEFAEICTRKAGGWYYLDGFAGNGGNRTQGFPAYMGSALIGVTTEPRARRAILIEGDPRRAEVLRTRVAPYDDRIFVEVGDCNEVLPQTIRLLDNGHIPGFCVLDPYSLDLHWKTVELIAKHRTHGTPYELLVYFPTQRIARLAAIQDSSQAEFREAELNRFFGNEDWKPIAVRQRANELKPQEPGLRYLALYKEQLRQLGYMEPLDRPSLRAAGGLMYHLVFATANEAGHQIMTRGLARGYGGQLPLQL